MEKSVLIALEMIVVVYLIGILLSYEDKTLWRSQGKVTMTFWWNLAVSVGLPIFAIINWLAVPAIMRAGYSWQTYLLCLVVGFIITSFLYQDWRKHKENVGHIIDAAGRITPAGWVHFIYMVPQIAVVMLFIVTPINKIPVFIIGTLFIIFLIIQDLQAQFIQKSLSGKMIFLRLTGAAALTYLKYVGIF